MNTIAQTRPVPFSKRFRFVARFTLWSVALGPLIGGAPFNWMLYPIPFAYMAGAVPALISGVLAALIIATFATHFSFGLITRLLVGAACGAAGCFLYGELLLNHGSNIGLYSNGVLYFFGVPAGALCALWYQRAWIDLDLAAVDHAVSVSEIENDQIREGDAS